MFGFSFFGLPVRIKLFSKEYLLLSNLRTNHARYSCSSSLTVKSEKFHPRLIGRCVCVPYRQIRSLNVDVYLP